jgi:hypothetical protein
MVDVYHIKNPQTNKGMGAKPMKNYKPNPVFAKHYRQLN